MPSNNHALIRYRTIDRCLKSKTRNYFLKDLIKECSDAVHEYEEHISGKTRPYKEISRRSLMYDLKFMKDEEYGFGAPIEYDRTEGYFYSDPNFAAFRAKLSQSDIEKFKEALSLLRQLTTDGQFSDIESMIVRLEETYEIKALFNRKSSIHFEHSTNVLGQQWLSVLRAKIANKRTLRIKYQPFDLAPYQRIISPYLLKEYNNRWFLVGYDHDHSMITNLGMDRIINIQDSIVEYYSEESYNPDTYTKDIIGVSIPKDYKMMHIQFKVYGKQRYYLETKPIHQSQTVINQTTDYSTFEVKLIPNYELESKLLAHGDSIEIISPAYLRTKIQQRIEILKLRYVM